MSSVSFVMPNDLSDLCRVCLHMPEESQYLDLTTIYDEEDNLTYGECFTICTQIDLSAGEGVPHCLCKTCGLELQMSYDFHKKIEESKKIIEQCQRHLEMQKTNTAGSSQNSNRLNSDANNVESIVQIMSDKYISDDEEQPATCQDMIEDVSEMQHENETEFDVSSEVEDETDEIDINKLSQTEVGTQHKQQPEKVNDTRLEPLKEVSAEVNAEQLEIEDYQNLEALEDDGETETLRIKCSENTFPMQIRKFKTVECEVSEEYMDCEAERKKEEKLEEKSELDENYLQETDNQDVEPHLRWKDNVVAVANREHLPIEDECLEEVELEVEEILCETFDNQTIVYESSQDENVEVDQGEVEGSESESNVCKTLEKKPNSNNNSKIRKRHVGAYSCDYCKRVFPNYSRMKTHRRCHEADRPKFSCSHCDRLYATKQARDCHIQTAHEKSGYTCNICNKVFAIRKSLEIHVRYHTGDFPYECNLCDKKFAQVCHLNTHVNVKHNQIRFSCDYPGCGKFFTSSSSLRNHQCTHGIMPFECEYCQQGYPAKAKLRVHIQRKHSMDLNNDQLEKMRKFHITRSKVSLVQFVET